MRHFISAWRAARRGLTACLLGGAAASCAISQQEEVALGGDVAAQIAAELPRITNSAIVNYINTLGNQLARVTDERGLTWRFYVVDSKEVNAFAVPGGWVYLNRGLIERATNMSQVAGVLAHEIAHVTERHSVQQMQKMQGANIGVVLACTLTGVCGGGAAQTAIGIGGSALFAKFSRSDEAEADAKAVATTVRAGISPNGIPGMFRILLAERQRNPGALDAFFASHPLAEDRITATEALIAGYSAAQLRGLTQETTAFQTFRRRLLALPPSPAPRKR
ncbi:MAG: M48 family metallopeptidase [Gemmatimonadales bacterium]